MTCIRFRLADNLMITTIINMMTSFGLINGVSVEILRLKLLRKSIEDEIIPRIKLNELYDLKNIISIWKNIDKSTSSELELIFTIITFEIWLKKFKIKV